ncbi:MAG: B12-binding domain-containing radical SAM protein [Thermoplasmata archaeon]|nr:MAG: B12-binding domain-containing radical SAM protein [Thermoplasmata archaeon]
MAINSSNPLLNSLLKIFIDKSDNHVDGVPIVLTSSRAEMSHYNNNPFVAFVCTFPHMLIPRKFKARHLRSFDNPDGTAMYVPYGLRKVEAILVSNFGRENVAVSHYDNLDKFVGPETKLICISTMDPMGLAYVSTTYNSLLGFGGEALNSYEFKRLIEHPSIQKYKPKIMVGGSGVWQIREAGYQDKFGIDVLMQGESEIDLIPTVKKMLAGKPTEKYIVTRKPDYSKVPFIKGAATYGTVEITRGCGRGCQFCSPTMRRKHSFPIEHVMKEVATTVKCGCNMIFANSEDVFLYKSHKGFKPNRPEIVKLFKSIADYPGVELIHLSHASLAPIIYDPKVLEELSPILLEKTDRMHFGKKFVTVEVGIETGSVRLMKKYMKGKAKPYSVDNWPELVVQGIGNMNDNDWYPLCTIMTGMPDETEDDVRATLDLLDDLKGSKMFYTPVLFIPLPQAMLSDARRINLDHLNALQWEFITTCWRNNVKFWMAPKTHWKIEMMTFMSYVMFYRWKHGKRSTKALLKLAGMPSSIISRHLDKSCEPEYCAPGEISHRHDEKVSEPIEVESGK